VGLPLDQELIAGREAARSYLLGAADAFWVPSRVLYRASIVRASDPFFPGSASSADLEACLNCLRQSDLGFVHQILSFERLHDEATTAQVAKMNSHLIERMRILVAVAPDFLSPDERDRRLDEQLSVYFAELAAACFNFRNREFWRLHQQWLGELGYSMYNRRFAKAITAKIFDLTLHPTTTTQKVVRRIKSYRSVRIRNTAL